MAPSMWRTKCILLAAALFGVVSMVGAAPAQASPETSNNWVSAIKVVAGGPTEQCGSGWTQDGQDLNEGARGAYIYLCKKFTTDRSQALTGIYVSMEEHWPKNYCGQQGADAVPVDLNQGAGGYFLYFCTTKSNQYSKSWIKDIGFTVWSVIPPLSNGPCETSAWKPHYPGGDPPKQGWQLAGVIQKNSQQGFKRGDLNEGAGGKYIYTCQYRVTIK